MRVLYVHPSPSFGGASKSLIESYLQLAGCGVKGVVVTPRGLVCDAFRQAGMEVIGVPGLSQFDNTRYGYYRGVRWLVLLREIFLFPFLLLLMYRLRREKFDILHVNEITLLPVGILLKKFLAIPMVVHVRSVQRKFGSGWRTAVINRWLGKHADAVVAIDSTVAGSLDSELSVAVIHNGLNVDSVESWGVSSEGAAVVRVGFLGVLIPLKGIFELLEAVRILKSRAVNIKLLVAGENARQLSRFKAWLYGGFGFARDVRTELEEIIQREELGSHVELLGFVSDVRTLYPKLDILCFPSHLDAAGRPVFEAAFYSVPSVVVVANPLPDTLLHEITGLAVPVPDPVLIADALQRLAEDPVFRRKLGCQAKVWAEKTFAIEGNAMRLLELYRGILSF